MPTLDDVLAGVPRDEALTTQEVADRVCDPAERWALRGTIRNRLYALESLGLVISDDNRPMRWLRPA